MVTVRYWAAARSAAGCEQEQLPASTIGELLEGILARHDMQRVLAACSLLVDGIATTNDQSERPLPDGAQVDVLPPFAGG